MKHKYIVTRNGLQTVYSRKGYVDLLRVLPTNTYHIHRFVQNGVSVKEVRIHGS